MNWCARLQEQVVRHNRWIAGKEEPLQMTYQSDIGSDEPLERIRASRQKDLLAQRTTIGPHRDDVLFLLGDHPFKSVASQGQRKTLLFALKLGERSLLESHLNIPPILLLDDVFEKLDPDRMRALLGWVCNETQSQVFITDTDPVRLQEQLTELHAEWQLLEIRINS
jgi:DNA replication and repair protein RecF